MNRKFVYGVDAGGTKTKVILGEVVDRKLVRIGEATGAAGNPRSVGFDKALDTIRETIREAYRCAGVEFASAESACFSVAGAGRSEERQQILHWCSTKGLSHRSIAVGDAECVMAAASGSGIGVALIAGTGSMAWGRSSPEVSTRAGGCGYLFDDEGSGYWISTLALRFVCGSGDARKTTTSLTEAILGHLKLAKPQDLIAWCYESSDTRRQIASLAPIVFDEYGRDHIAGTIVNAGAAKLAELVDAVALELSFDDKEFTLACAGSLLTKQPLYRNLIETELKRKKMRPREIYCVEDPAVGALNIAWSHL